VLSSPMIGLLMSHHRGSEDTERETDFFVYREIPIDEKSLSNQIHETAFFLDAILHI
jgi:hypothetical protein